MMIVAAHIERKVRRLNCPDTVRAGEGCGPFIGLVNTGFIWSLRVSESP